MKPQDVLLLFFLLFLLWRNNKTWTLSAGILLLLLSMPLFAKHIFFTAEHLVWFGALYFLVAIFQILIHLKGRKLNKLSS